MNKLWGVKMWGGIRKSMSKIHNRLWARTRTRTRTRALGNSSFHWSLAFLIRNTFFHLRISFRNSSFHCSLTWRWTSAFRFRSFSFLLPSLACLRFLVSNSTSTTRRWTTSHFYIRTPIFFKSNISLDVLVRCNYKTSTKWS